MSVAYFLIQFLKDLIEIKICVFEHITSQLVNLMFFSCRDGGAGTKGNIFNKVSYCSIFKKNKITWVFKMLYIFRKDCQFYRVQINTEDLSLQILFTESGRNTISMVYLEKSRAGRGLYRMIT